MKIPRHFINQQLATKQVRQKGFLLVLLVSATFLTLMFTAVIGQLAVSNFGMANDDIYRISTQLAVDAAIDQAVVELNANDSWTGPGSTTTLSNQNNVRVTYDTTIETASPTKKSVNVTAKAYFPSGSTTPKQTRKVSVELESTGPTGPVSGYGFVAGAGGLSMASQATIDSVSDVYINGRLSLNMLSTLKAPNIYVANQSCPKSGTAGFPRVCTPGEYDNPITLGMLSSITGAVRANNQLKSSGMSSPGLIAGEEVQPVSLPDYNRATQKNNVATTKTDGFNCSTPTSSTWPANYKIVGNANISSMCTVYVQGDVWITGNFNVASNGRLTVAEGVVNRPTIMVDGSSGFEIVGTASVHPNSAGVGVDIITFYSDASCSPDCTSLPSSNVKSSMDKTTIKVASLAYASKANLYARWTKLSVGSASVVGSLAGQTIDLNSVGLVKIDHKVTGIVSPGSTGSGWRVISYRKIY